MDCLEGLQIHRGSNTARVFQLIQTEPQLLGEALHESVVAQHLGGNSMNSVADGSLDKALHQLCAQAVSLVIIRDQNRNLCRLAIGEFAEPTHSQYPFHTGMRVGVNRYQNYLLLRISK